MDVRKGKTAMPTEAEGPLPLLRGLLARYVPTKAAST
jgi:hypothetical protein